MLRYALPVLTFLAVSVGHSAPEFVLSSDGATTAAIRLTGDTDVDHLAARELQEYVRRVTGAELPLVETGNIVLESGDSPGREERYAIDVTPEGVRIQGNCPVSLLFGVYDFLETYLGCRWYAGDEIGETIPSRPTVRVAPVSRSEQPAIPVRTFFLRAEPEMWWALRNRLNGFFTKEFVDALGSGTRQSLLYLPPGQGGIHAWHRILPAEKYFDKHPEYFALVDGKRQRARLRNGQICTSNPEVVDLIAKAARDYFEADPNARVFSIAPNDGYGWCECDECRAIDEKFGGARTWRNGRAIVSDRLVHFANQVAEKALKDLPGRELFIFAYVNYVVPPQVVQPAEGVTVWLCHYAPACYAHPISDENCPDNQQFLEHLTAWAQTAERLGIYAYTDKSMWEGLPRPIVRQMMADIELFHSFHVPRYVAQSSARNWGQMGALYWVTTKKLWDPDRPLDPLLDDWYKGFFGEAAAPMRQFVERLERSVAESGEHYSASPWSEGPRVFSRQAIGDARVLLESATTLAADEKIRERVATVARSFEAGTVGLAYAHAYKQYTQTGDKGAMAEAIVAAEVLAKSGGRRGKQFKAIVQGLRMELETGFLWSAFGEEEQLGGRSAWNSDETGLGDNAAGWATFEMTVPDRTAPYSFKVSAWGKSTGFSPVICSKGEGKGYSSGGEWTPLKLIQGKLSAKEQWDDLVFGIDPAWFDPAGPRQRIGFGGADSQVWISDVGLEKSDPAKGEPAPDNE